VLVIHNTEVIHQAVLKKVSRAGQETIIQSAKVIGFYLIS